MDKRALSPELPAGYAPGTPVLVALSGGADSTLLVTLLRRAGIRTYAVHVHHGIRGREADRDAEFCRRLCRTLHVPLFTVKINVPAIVKKTGKSPELAAREARYRHFARLMRAHAIPLLATAHHADDNLETLLFRLCRGTGVTGLCGIPALSPLPGTDPEAGLCVFRPLLHLTKKQILQACEELHLDYVVDSTNQSLDYARNRIRCRVVPELEALFAHPQHAATRLCRAAKEDCDALDAVARTLYLQNVRDGRLPRDLFADLPAALAKRIMILLLEDDCKRRGAQPPMPEAVHLDAALSHVLSGKHGSISLPARLALYTDRDAIWVGADRRTSVTPDYTLPLVQGWQEIAGTSLALWVRFPGNTETDTPFDTNVYNLYTELQVRFDTINGAAFWRPIKPSDTVLCKGMHKKVRKLYGSFGIPRDLRPALPLLTDADGIVAVPGICLRDSAQVRGAEPALLVGVYLKKQFDT